MSDPFLGEIRFFGFSFAPKGWAQCDGAPLPCAQNAALYSLLGNQFGGNRVNFNLPDFRGRVPVHRDEQAHDYCQSGLTGGTESVTLTPAQLPAHTHAFLASIDEADRSTPGSDSSRCLAVSHSPILPVDQTYLYAEEAHATPMHPSSTGNTGGGQSHNNMQPYLAINFCIAITGQYPSRN